MISMNRPSRGLVESATTIRNIGAFLRPVRRRRMRTAMVLVLLDQSVYCTELIARLVFPNRTRLAHTEHVRPELAATGLSRSGLLHHLLHLAELLEQAIHLAHRAATAARNTRAARAVHYTRILSLGRCHRQHDRFDVFHPLRIGRLDLLQHLRVHTRQHFEQALEGAELLDLTHGREEIIQVHALFLYLLLEAPRLVCVEGFLRFFDETDDITLLQNATGHALWMELLQGVGLFTHTDVFDRFLGDAVDRERRTTARIAIHLGEDDAGDVKALVEALGDADSVLPGHSVRDEENLVGMNRVLEMIQLGHHLIVDLEATGGIDDDDPISRALCRIDAGLRNPHHV